MVLLLGHESSSRNVKVVPIKDRYSEVERGSRKEFDEAQNKNPNISIEDWLGRYIFIDIHDIFFGGIHRDLYEWLARLADTQFEIRSRTLVVWMSTLIKKVKRVDNALSRGVDHWFDSTIGGYIIEFVVDKGESYSQVERYFFKGPRGKFIHFLNLRIKMLLHENNILKIQQIGQIWKS
jgi:hypothetical protein